MTNAGADNRPCQVDYNFRENDSSLFHKAAQNHCAHAHLLSVHRGLTRFASGFLFSDSSSGLPAQSYFPAHSFRACCFLFCAAVAFRRAILAPIQRTFRQRSGRARPSTSWVSSCAFCQEALCFRLSGRFDPGDMGLSVLRIPIENTFMGTVSSVYRPILGIKIQNAFPNKIGAGMGLDSSFCVQSPFCPSYADLPFMLCAFLQRLCPMPKTHMVPCHRLPQSRGKRNAATFFGMLLKSYKPGLPLSPWEFTPSNWIGLIPADA